MKKLLLLLLGLVGGTLYAQTATTLTADSVETTSTGFAVRLHYTVPPRDSLVVTKQLNDKAETLVARYGASTAIATYSRLVSISRTAIGIYTFRTRRWLGGKVADSASVKVSIGVTPPPPVAEGTVIKVDTVVTTRVAGDTTFTTRLVITTRAFYDTVKTVTFTVATPPPPAVVKADSVTLAGWALASYDTLHWVTGNFKVYPLTMAGWVNMRWLLNGTQVATSSQVQHYSTARFPRPADGVYGIVGCARVQNQLASTPEVCSRPFPLTIGTPLPPPPPVDTTPTVRQGIVMLAMGEPTNMYKWNGSQWVPGTDSLMMPVWAHYQKLADSGQRILLFTGDTAMLRLNLDTLQTVKLKRPAPGQTVRYGLCGEQWDTLIKMYRRACFGAYADTTQADWYRYTEPNAPLPQPTGISPTGTKRIVRLSVSPAHAVFFTGIAPKAKAMMSRGTAPVSRKSRPWWPLAAVVVILGGLAYIVLRDR